MGRFIDLMLSVEELCKFLQPSHNAKAEAASKAQLKADDIS